MKTKLSPKFFFAIAMGAIATLGNAKEPATATAKKESKPLVQIAVLLDTSNSMDGLIEQAKGQLWKICNEFIKAQQNGVAPEVQVALYEYGKTSLSRESGWIRQIQPLVLTPSEPKVEFRPEPNAAALNWLLNYEQ
jgi:hypothetical protein